MASVFFKLFQRAHSHPRPHGTRRDGKAYRAPKGAEIEPRALPRRLRSEHPRPATIRQRLLVRRPQNEKSPAIAGGARSIPCGKNLTR